MQLLPTLYHFWLSPGCRLVRLLLAEKRVAFDLKLERAWERREEFLALNPAGTTPVLVMHDDAAPIADTRAVVEFLDESFRDPPLIGTDRVSRAETRRLLGWFDDKFAREVSEPLLHERVIKGLAQGGTPDGGVIRAARWNVQVHLDYVGYLAERRRWLAGDDITVADLAAAAHLSVVDYLGEVPWDRNQEARAWYSRMKSRPSFRPLLGDRLGGFPPPAHYDDLDF